MKKFVIVCALTLTAGGCNIASEEDQLENSIRNTLSSRGEVKQVEITKQSDDNFTGFAVVRSRDGREGRLNCTATRRGGSGTNFDWRCLPTIDEATISEVENNIREFYRGRQIEVSEIDLERVDDQRMRGGATLQDNMGNRARVDCTATRENVETTNFRWECNPAEGGAAAPDAGSGAAPPPAAGDKPTDGG